MNEELKWTGNRSQSLRQKLLPQQAITTREVQKNSITIILSFENAIATYCRFYLCPAIKDCHSLGLFQDLGRKVFSTTPLQKMEVLLYKSILNSQRNLRWDARNKVSIMGKVQAIDLSLSLWNSHVDIREPCIPHLWEDRCWRQEWDGRKKLQCRSALLLMLISLQRRLPL